MQHRTLCLGGVATGCRARAALRDLTDAGGEARASQGTARARVACGSWWPRLQRRCRCTLRRRHRRRAAGSGRNASSAAARSTTPPLPPDSPPPADQTLALGEGADADCSCLDCGGQHRGRSCEPVTKIQFRHRGQSWPMPGVICKCAGMFRMESMLGCRHFIILIAMFYSAQIRVP